MQVHPVSVGLAAILGFSCPATHLAFATNLLSCSCHPEVNLCANILCRCHYNEVLHLVVCQTSNAYSHHCREHHPDYGESKL